MLITVALILAIFWSCVAIVYLAWKLIPHGYLTIAVNGGGIMFVIADILSYMAGLSWDYYLPEKWSLGVMLLVNILAIIARSRTMGYTAPMGHYDEPPYRGRRRRKRRIEPEGEVVEAPTNFPYESS